MECSLEFGEDGMIKKSRARIAWTCICMLITGLAAGQKAELSSRLARSLTTASAYEYGESREALSEIDEIVKSAVGSPEICKQVEAQFIDFLESNATLASKQFICRKLAVMGTRASVPALSKMLNAGETFDMALYALEKIPSDRVDKILFKSMQEARGKRRIGLMNTLGIRRYSPAVGTLANDALDEDREKAAAAVRALSRIGTDEAAGALRAVYQQTTGPIRNEAMNGYLRCADRMAETGAVDKARSMYRDFLIPDAIRSAALAGMIRTDAHRAGEIILEILQGDDFQLKTTAIRHVGRFDKIEPLDPIAAALPRLSAQHQIQLITALAERGDPGFRDAIVDAADHDDPGVRIAAIKALGILGDASSIDLLVARALEGGPEQEAARESLYRMRGVDVDRAIVSKLGIGDPDMKIEMLEGIGQRNITSAVQTVMNLTGDDEPRVRRDAVKTLGLIGSPDALPEIIDVLIAATSADVRREAERTVVALSRQIGDAENQASFVMASLPKAESVESKCSLLEVLGRIGDTHALEYIRQGLSDTNAEIRKASIRALSEWPDAGPIDDLFGIAGSSREEAVKILALRGCIRLIGADQGIEAGEKVDLYTKAFRLATGTGERRMVLSGLAGVNSIEAMETAALSLEDPDLRQEAETAVILIAGSLWRRFPQQVLPFLVGIVQSTTDDDHREDAQGLIDRIRRLEN